MRRATISLTCAVVLLAVSACDSKQTQATARPTPEPTGNVCERVRPNLAGSWKVENAEPRFYTPLSDSCLLVDAAHAENRIRISVSALTVTAAEATQLRKAEELNLRRSNYAAGPIDGGVGPESWAVNPAAVAPWIVFRSSERMIRVLGVENGGLDVLRTVAQAIDVLPEGINAPAMVQRPECERGTAAAGKVLGTKAAARRDTIVDGFVHCQWGSATRGVSLRAGRDGSDPALNFKLQKDAGAESWTGVRRVNVGTEGWQDSDGTLVYRVGQSTFVDLFASPSSGTRAAVLALGQSMAPAYVR